MPFSGFQNFDDCVSKLTAGGEYTEEEARKICGALQAEAHADDGMVQRLDVGTLSNVQRTPQGGLSAQGNLTRTGIFVYRNPDGSQRRELRHPDDVFKADSLQTLVHAPVTLLHPPVSTITPENWRIYSIGHVGADVRQDGRFIAATVIIQDQKGIDKIERDKITQNSCGYRCRIDQESGTYEGQPYDVRQRDITYNHLAVVPKGRAGADVALRLDADGNQSWIEATEDEEKMADKVLVRIDSTDYEKGSDAHLAKIEQMHQAELEKEKARADSAEGERDAAVKKVDQLQAKLDAATDPKTISSAVTRRAKLLSRAKEVLAEDQHQRLDGLSDREIMVAVIRHDDKDFDDDQKSDVYIEAFFDARRTDSAPRRRGIDSARRAAADASRQSRQDRHDSDNESSGARAARRRMLERNAKAADKSQD